MSGCLPLLGPLAPPEVLSLDPTCGYAPQSPDPSRSSVRFGYYDKVRFALDTSFSCFARLAHDNLDEFYYNNMDLHNLYLFSWRRHMLNLINYYLNTSRNVYFLRRRSRFAIIQICLLIVLGIIYPNLQYYCST